MSKHVMVGVDGDDGGTVQCLGCRQYVYGSLTESPPGECQAPYKSPKQLLAESVAREAALRDELAQTKDVLAIANETLGKFSDDSRVSQQRLTAAEQRNAASDLLLSDVASRGRLMGWELGLVGQIDEHLKSGTGIKLAQFIEIVDGCYHLASSYSPCLDNVDEHGGDDHEDPTCAIFHRLYYAMFLVRKPVEGASNDR